MALRKDISFEIVLPLLYNISKIQVIPLRTLHTMEKEFALSIAICEDDAGDAKHLRSMIAQSRVKARVELFCSAEELLAAWKPGKYHMAFLDIYLKDGMPGGLHAASVMRTADRGLVIVFTTSSMEHALESYALGAPKYLLKPAGAAEVAEALAFAQMYRNQRQHMKLPIGGGFISIPLDAICFFEKRKHDIIVHTVSEELVPSRTETLDSLYERLPTPPFLRCHRSFIVNFERVARVGCDFIMEDGKVAYIRQNDREKHVSAYNQWCLDGAGEASQESAVAYV
jgi:DNA-binding LytR/AlgR family response regulator